MRENHPEDPVDWIWLLTGAVSTVLVIWAALQVVKLVAR
jgi:hypothetical protein